MVNAVDVYGLVKFLRNLKMWHQITVNLASCSFIESHRTLDFPFLAWMNAKVRCNLILN